MLEEKTKQLKRFTEATKGLSKSIKTLNKDKLLAVVDEGGVERLYHTPEDEQVYVELHTIKDGVIFGILKDVFTDFKWISYTWDLKGGSEERYSRDLKLI